MTIFALYSSEAGLVLERAGDALLWRHLGLPVETTGLPPLARTRGAATFSLDEDMPFATAPGLGWFGPLAVSVAGRVLRWAVTDVAADADSLRFTLTDADTGLLLEQCFRLAPGGGFAISATMGNNGPVPIAVDHLASALLPLPAGLDRVLSWRGRHAAEFVESVEPLPAHQWRRETRRGLPGHGAYCASKAAVFAYCESLRGECRPHGVQVVTIAPGYIDKPLTQRNRYRMPFLMAPEAFADRAFVHIGAGARTRFIPWQMGVVASLLRWLPDALFDRLLAGRPRKRRQHE